MDEKMDEKIARHLPDAFEIGRNSAQKHRL
jgi:hypothetical protein